MAIASNPEAKYGDGNRHYGIQEKSGEELEVTIGTCTSWYLHGIRFCGITGAEGCLCHGRASCVSSARIKMGGNRYGCEKDSKAVSRCEFATFRPKMLKLSLENRALRVVLKKL